MTRDAIHARLQGQQFAMHGHGAIWGLCELAPETKQLSACNQIVLYRTIQYDLITSRFRGKIIALWVCWRHAAQVVVTCAAISVALLLINSAARCA